MDYFCSSMGPVGQGPRDDGIDKGNVHEAAFGGGPSRTLVVRSKAHELRSGERPARPAIPTTPGPSVSILVGLAGAFPSSTLVAPSGCPIRPHRGLS